MFQDLQYGWRMLVKTKGLAIAAALSLALGIGANAVAFGLLDAVLLKPIPVRAPEELVRFRWVAPPNSMVLGIQSAGDERAVFSYPAYQAFVRENRTLASLFAWAPLNRVNAVVDGQAEIALGELVSGDFYSGLGLAAFRGRTITAEDDRPTAEPVAVISYTYWNTRFGLNADVIGKKISVNGVPVTVIGVTPPEFYGAEKVGSTMIGRDISIPFAMGPRIELEMSEQGGTRFDQPWFWWINVMGRLRPGTRLAEVNGNFETALGQAALEGWNAAPLQRREGRPQDPVRPGLAAIAGGSGISDITDAILPLALLESLGVLVLLVICTNVANLMLARSATRQQEVTVRLAVGAGRWRIVRQLLTESALLGLIGGVLGVGVGYWGIRLIAANNVVPAPVSLDLRTLAFTAAIAISTGILFGLAPALKTTNPDLITILKDTGRGVSGSRSRLGKVLLVAQMSFSLILLIVAGLMVRTIDNLQRVEPGFNINNLLSFGVNPELNRYKPEQTSALYDRLTDGIQSVPGVTAVTMSQFPLLGGGGSRLPLYVEGSRQGGQSVATLRVGANFFETMEIPLVLGRSFSSRDVQNAPLVAVVNESAARTYFPGSNPIGKRFGFAAEAPGAFEIVGVVKDAKYFRLGDADTATVYTAAGQARPRAMFFEVRTESSPLALLPALREAVRQVDRDLPLFEVTTKVTKRNEGITPFRAAAVISSAFGLLVLVLACIGLYGIMSYNVERRVSEIGLRMALGARRRHVIGFVMGQTLRLVVVGLAIGLAASWPLTSLIGFLFYGVKPNDPLTVAVAVSIMLAIAGLAGYLPARRAAKIDPMAALRRD